MKVFVNVARPPQRPFPLSALPRGFLWGSLTALTLLWACSGDASGKPNVKEPGLKPAVPVAVSTVAQKTVPVQLRAIGNVQAYSTVTVKAQVEGELHRVHFTEGQDMKKGDLLFTIDPRPFEARLKQAEANLAKDLVQVENARKEERRYAELFEQGYATQQQYDQIRTNTATLEATVHADQAAVDNAKLQLAYCFLRSPIDGRTGNLLVHQGNLVKANDNDNPLVVINQLSPIYVAFSVPEQHLPDIQKYMAAGKLPVEALLPNEEPLAQGELTFVDNAVNLATGTIQLKATFSNRDKALWPGQFVNVVLTLTTQPNAVVVPSQAVQTGQTGQYVFVVKPDLTVESRPIVSDRVVSAETVVKAGLTPGEKVVTDGQLRLVPGARVAERVAAEASARKENPQ